jgi:hypothetical protein
MSDRSATSVRCPQCAAPIQDAEAKQCIFCGTALPREAPRAAPPEVPQAAPRSASVGELLASVEQHPDYGRWCDETPSSGAAVGRPAGQIVAGLVFAAFAIVMLTFSRSMGAPGPFRMFLLVFVFLGVGMAVVALVKLASFSTSALEHVPALIVDKRTHISGGGSDSSARTKYFATLERGDGSRSEVDVYGARYGEIAAGDWGLAYLRAGVLLDFKRVGSR